MLHCTSGTFSAKLYEHIFSVALHERTFSAALYERIFSVTLHERTFSAELYGRMFSAHCTSAHSVRTIRAHIWQAAEMIMTG